MATLNTVPISSLACRNPMIDSDTLLPLSSFSAFNPNYSSLFAPRKVCGPVLRFLEVKQRKKGYSLRICNKRNLDWDSEGTQDLETEILEFMKNSEKPGMFPSKNDLIRRGRFDLVERILDQGGWLSMGWDSNEQEYEDIEEEEEKQLHGDIDLSSNTSSSREEIDSKDESGIEGILTRLEKERNLSLGVSLRDKGEIDGVMNDISSNGSVPWSSMVVTASEFQEAKPDSSLSETWRTWSMRRAGFTDEDFEAAEISTSGLAGVKKGNTSKDSHDSVIEKEKASSSPEDIDATHIKSHLQNLQSELSSVLHSLRSQPDDLLTSKDSEINSGNLENLSDDSEFKENEIMYAQNKLRSTRAKLAVLEGKMAMAIIDAQRTVREKQRKIDHASRALRLLRTASIIWPNSASEVLLTGSFDGWSTQRKMKKAQNGVFSLSLKLYPGKYEIKFIVDGQWKVDPLRPIVTCDGYENNLLIIS
ncbi:unnamed protein product [Cochlearia groenlandica]